MPMVKTAILIALPLLGGCSVLDELSLSAGNATLDPTKIYLQGHQRAIVPAHDVGDYDCTAGSLICHKRAVDYECQCAPQHAITWW